MLLTWEWRDDWSDLYFNTDVPLLQFAGNDDTSAACVATIVGLGDILD
jgi:hypothetical protein